jgi:hypothetical protein
VLDRLDAAAHPPLEVDGRERPAQGEPLDLVAAEAGKPSAVGKGLHPLGHDREAQLLSEGDD